MSTDPAPPAPSPTETIANSPSLGDVFDLELIDCDLYRSRLVFPDPLPLYGGQVAAQALLAAGMTVPDGRRPHSLHSYFLRRGDAARPVVFRVDHDRDGRSFSARRVVAVQDGKVIFNMSASFHDNAEGPVHHTSAPTDAEPADECPAFALGRVFSIDARLPTQPPPAGQWPSRFWARATDRLAGPLQHACVLTYISDLSSGLSGLADENAFPGPSLDHVLWFHRALQADEWLLVDMRPGTVGGGRGWYTGSITDAHGVLGASFAQESLFRPGPNPFLR